MIRSATKWDIPQILDILRLFRLQCPVGFTSSFDNESYVNSLITSILAGAGVLQVAEINGKIIGIIIGIIQPMIWDPDTKILNELAYYVIEEHRGSSAGLRLLKSYIEHAEKLKNEQRIHAYTMLLMANSPKLKLERYGFVPLETVYLGGYQGEIS